MRETAWRAHDESDDAREERGTGARGVDKLFNKRDYAAAERFWSPNDIQHNAHIAPGRDGLFNLIKSMPPTLEYEPGTVVAEGYLVIVHDRFSAARVVGLVLLPLRQGTPYNTPVVHLCVALDRRRRPARTRDRPLEVAP
jgi:hypothetical protein